MSRPRNKRGQWLSRTKGKRRGQHFRVRGVPQKPDMSNMIVIKNVRHNPWGIYQKHDIKREIDFLEGVDHTKDSGILPAWERDYYREQDAKEQGVIVNLIRKIQTGSLEEKTLAMLELHSTYPQAYKFVHSYMSKHKVPEVTPPVVAKVKAVKIKIPSYKLPTKKVSAPTLKPKPFYKPRKGESFTEIAKRKIAEAGQVVKERREKAERLEAEEIRKREEESKKLERQSLMFVEREAERKREEEEKKKADKKAGVV